MVLPKASSYSNLLVNSDNAPRVDTQKPKVPRKVNLSRFPGLTGESKSGHITFKEAEAKKVKQMVERQLCFLL